MVRAAEHPYVTVRDYLVAVHPWLMGSQGDILWTLNLCEDELLPAETKLVVNYTALDRLNSEKESDWVPFKGGDRPSPPRAQQHETNCTVMPLALNAPRYTLAVISFN